MSMSCEKALIFLLYLSFVVNLAYGYWLKGNFLATLNCLVCALFTINSDYAVLIVLNVTSSYMLSSVILNKILRIEVYI